MKKSLIPNFLTTLRILIAPIVIVFLLCPFGPIVYHLDRFLDCSFQLSFLLSGVLFIIACVSD
jgi:phosphatidylglycerophosphate synthase